MDNQQALTESEKGWLSGFFDGEGCVDLHIADNYAARKRSTQRQTIIIPRLSTVNTDYATIMYFKSLMNKAGVGVYVGTRRRNVAKHKQCYEATIHGFKRCTKALPLFAYSITKKAQFKVMADWFEYRKTTYHYTLKDYEFCVEFNRVKDSRKGLNDSTLRRLYDSCTSELNHSEGVKKAWKSRRKIESTLPEKSCSI